MTYTKILFNNIKEYTPKFIKTITPKNATGPVHIVKANRAWRFT